MNLDSKKTSRIILGITALVCSRVMFAFFNDPEGPNLLIVVAMAIVLYDMSLAPYAFHSPHVHHRKKFVLAVLIQILLIIILYFLLR